MCVLGGINPAVFLFITDTYHLELEEVVAPEEEVLEVLQA
jgi:hypothetical protein